MQTMQEWRLSLQREQKSFYREEDESAVHFAWWEHPDQ
jgi:hypothetical protein